MISALILQTKWAPFLESEMKLPYFDALEKSVLIAYQNAIVYPKFEHVFDVLKTEPKDVRVVILGHEPHNFANCDVGLAFSLNLNAKLSRNLIAIFEELHREDDSFRASNGDLKKWQEQGVFLLNNIFTVQHGKPNSHESFGWQKLTNAICRVIDAQSSGAVWMLWGQKAQNKRCLINRGKHKVLQAPHPMMEQFAGNNHFILANLWLASHGYRKIEWTLK